MKKIFLVSAVTCGLGLGMVSRANAGADPTKREPAQTGSIGSVKLAKNVAASCRIDLNAAGGERFELDLTDLGKKNTLDVPINARYSAKIHIRQQPLSATRYSVVLQIFDLKSRIYNLSMNQIDLSAIKSTETSANLYYMDADKFPTEEFKIDGAAKSVKVGSIQLICGLNSQ